MLEIMWKHCLCIFTFVFIMGNSDIRTVATPGILPDGSSPQIGLDDTQETVRFLLSQSVLQKGIQVAHYQSHDEDKGGISRRKRNMLFPSGVKLCAEETVEQAIANHLDYFHLRVCQETVWEAYNIFWDRLPEHNEYQDWMTMCREGRVSTLDIGTNFSQSSEHIALVHRRMSLSGSNSEASNSWLHVCSFQTTTAPSEPDAATTQKEDTLWPETFTVGLTPKATQEITEEAKQEIGIGEEATTSVIQEVNLGVVHGVTLAAIAASTEAGQDTDDKVEEDTVSTTDKASSEITNDIELDNLTRPTWSMREQIVELITQLKGQVYSDALKDPFSLYYQRLAQQFIEKIEDTFERLPGFKNVALLEFRPQRDAKGDQSAVVVHYTVTLEVDGGINQETVDYINLLSNLVGNSYPEVDGRPALVNTITDVECSSPSKSAEDMDNILTAAHRRNLPEQDLNNNDVFSVHSSDSWPGSQDEEASVNDAIILDEGPNLSFTAGVPNPAPGDLPSTLDNGGLEDEGLIYGNKVVTKIKPTESLEMGKIAEEVSPGAGITDMAGPVQVPPCCQDEKSALHLLDTGSGSGLAGEELGPLLPMAATLEDSPMSSGDVEHMEKEKEEEDGVRTETSSKSPVSSSDGPHLQSSFESANEPLDESLAPSQVDLDFNSDLDDDVVLAFTEAPLYVDVAFYSEEPDVWMLELPVHAHTNTPMSSESPSKGDDEGDQILGMEEGMVVLVTEGPSEISDEERANDEILVISPTMTESVPEMQNTASPMHLSPEESPFTLIDFVPEITPQASSSNPHSPAVELRLTTQSPFYQPKLRPTEDLLGAKVSSNEEEDVTRISIKPASIDPTMPNEQGNQYGQAEAPGDPLVIDLDHSFDVPHYGRPGSTGGEGSSEYPSGIAHGTAMVSVAKVNNGSPLGRALMVFFSLRVTNMMFSDDLFNKSSAEYKALEQRFLELLVPYLQSNLSNFQNLEILNFRNGSIVVNSRMKFGKPMPHGVTNAVYLILEDFCNTAYQTMNLAIDKYSLDVESGELADPCKFQACNEFSECTVNRWSGEGECVCNAGYFSVDGLPCQSVCDLRHDFCLNDGKCDIIPGQGAICRCRVGENWWYRGEHCEEYVSEPLVVGIAIASVAGFLLVASGIIFFLARTLRDQYDKDETEDPIRHGDSTLSLERATKYNPMYESDITTGYSHYYRRYPEMPCYSSASAEASTDFSSEEIRHIYENSELTREEIQDRIRIIELYAKDRQFADFFQQHQVSLDIQRESSSK